MSHPFPASKRKTSSRAAMLADDSSPRVLRPAPLRQAVYDAIIEPVSYTHLTLPTTPYV